MKKIPLALVFVSTLVLGIGCSSTKKAYTVFDTQQNEIFIDSMMANALDKGFFPGAQIIVGNKDSVFLNKNYGFHDYSKKELVTSADVYDLASMSKVLGATLVTMRLVSDGEINVNEKLADIVPIYKNTAIADLTIFEFLTHTSGLTPSITFYQSLLSTSDGLPFLNKEKSENYIESFDNMYVSKNILYDDQYLAFEPKANYVKVFKNMWLNPEFYKIVYQKISKANTNKRGEYLYSDLNLLLVKQMIEAKTNKKLDQLAHIQYTEMGIKNIGFNPLNWTSNKNVIPTEIDNFFRKDTIKGYVHDEAAAIFGGVSGNAGLFANASSIAVICQMLLNKGKYEGKKIIKSRVIKEYTKSPLSKKGIYRGLGFDKRKPSEIYKKNDFGHTGFTGTFFFLNPDSGRFLIILSNRVNPSRTNRLMYKDDFSSKIWQQINK